MAKRTSIDARETELIELDRDCMYISFLTTWTATTDNGEVMIQLAPEFLAARSGRD